MLLLFPFSLTSDWLAFMFYAPFAEAKPPQTDAHKFCSAKHFFARSGSLAD